ncbi:conserved hypothetical protein [Rhodopseudomonas palustris TIE-1]|uniref:phage tail tape measure protein n=1 Tax=Rhodopseudomonas palustris TaxID=1076 RepID=UPI000164A56D|nr:phage tail tape measure protein [Rhodopseudomonas palustris]ACF01848.1 conserved hypothetical protein [Rhodopseudomonas palustris TIE-1]
MRVSLVIDGDSNGAVEAATDASKAVTDLGTTATDTAKGLEDGFKKASGAAGSMKGSAEAAGAANDNLLASTSALLSKFGELASKAKGSNDALALNASTASSLTASLGALSRSVGVVGFLTGAIGLATAALSAYNELSARASREIDRQLTEQARLINVVRGAYQNAKTAAGDFYEQSKDVTLLQLRQNQVDLQRTLQTQVGSFIGGVTSFGDSLGNYFNNVKTIRGELLPFEDAIFRLNDGFKQGKPDVEGFVNEIARIALLDPSLQKAASDLITKINEASKTARALKDLSSGEKVIEGKDKPEDRKRVGITDQVSDTAGQFERLAKSMDRQAASAEAEASATGKSAGEIAKLRVEAVLTEAAQQAGGGTAEKYAERIKQIGDRAGEAAQKLALARVQSDAAFQRQTLGLSADDAQIAEQLRGAYGDNVQRALSSADAAALKFNQDMLQLKNTTLDVSKGVFTDFRTSIQQGATAMEALGNAGVNAIGRIADKIASTQLDNLVSGLFGAFTGGSGGGLLSSLFGGGSKGSFATDGIGGFGPTFTAADGGTFGPGWGVVGERGAEIIKVHAGGVTVFPHHVSKPYLPGFADGGSLDQLGNIARLPSFQSSSSGGSAGSAAPQEFRLSVSVDDDGKLKTVVTDVAKGIAQEVSAGTVKDFVRSPQFTDHVARAYGDAKAAWKIRS